MDAAHGTRPITRPTSFPPRPLASSSVRRRIPPPSSGPLRVPASRALSSTFRPDPGKPHPSRHLAGRRLVLLAVSCRFLVRPYSSRLLLFLLSRPAAPSVVEPSIESAISRRALVEAAAPLISAYSLP